MRTMVVAGSSSLVARFSRACALAAGATASSRSMMTASDRSAALANRSGRSAGANSSAGPMVNSLRTEMVGSFSRLSPGLV